MVDRNYSILTALPTLAPDNVTDWKELFSAIANKMTALKSIMDFKAAKDFTSAVKSYVYFTTSSTGCVATFTLSSSTSVATGIYLACTTYAKALMYNRSHLIASSARSKHIK